MTAKQSESSPQKMPVLFIGHGSPMNAIEENEFTAGWIENTRSIPRPKSILSISAHWFIPSTRIGVMEHPQTIHDFYGFPRELYEQQYPAPGAPELAKRVARLVHSVSVELDDSWGLDHGTWSVLKRVYPAADIPVTQLSINYTMPPQYHYQIGEQLAPLRDEGVLILGSGNMVHNLGAIRFDKLDSCYTWAGEFDEWVSDRIKDGDYEHVIDTSDLGVTAQLAHPTPDHFLPLLYVLGASQPDERIQFFNQKCFAGSITMTSVKIG